MFWTELLDLYCLSSQFYYLHHSSFDKTLCSHRINRPMKRFHKCHWVNIWYRLLDYCGFESESWETGRPSQKEKSNMSVWNHTPPSAKSPHVVRRIYLKFKAEYLKLESFKYKCFWIFPSFLSPEINFYRIFLIRKLTMFVHFQTGATKSSYRLFYEWSIDRKEAIS